MNVYHRKLYALLHNPQVPYRVDIAQQVQCLKEHPQLQSWWQSELGQQSQDISSASDRVNLNPNAKNSDNSVQVSHPISGQSQQAVSRPLDHPRLPTPQLQQYRFCPRWCYVPRRLGVRTTSQTSLFISVHLLASAGVY